MNRFFSTCITVRASALLSPASCSRNRPIAGPRRKPTPGTSSNPGWWAAIIFPPPRSTNWRCGRPRRSIPTDRQGTWLGRRPGHEHHARLPARSAVAAGRRGFQQRLDQFLTIAAKHHIRPVLVLFDSCWDPLPKLGPQHAPIQGVHNSGWVQSPGAKALKTRRSIRG